jgi:hypothetical protein
MGLKQIAWEAWSGFILLIIETNGALVNTVTNDRIPQKQGNFLVSSATISFSRTYPFQGMGYL